MNTEKKLKVLDAAIEDMTTTLTEADTRISEAEKRIDAATKNREAADTNLTESIDAKINAAIEKLPKTDGTAPPSPFRWFEKGKRYWCPVTYWWADQQQQGSKWEAIFENLDIVGFVIINPRSGFGERKENDFEDLATRLKNVGKPGVAYIRTIKGTRSKEEILEELRKYQDAYHLEGVFLDEMVNGWNEEEAAKIPFYTDLYKAIKKEYGDGFLVVGNPGTNTKAELLDAADVLMTFENSAVKYLNDAEAPVTPDHYRAESPLRFVHAIHDTTSTEQAVQVLEKASTAGAAFVYVTNDTFTGVPGSESPTNNPWDSLPSTEIMARTFAWCRRQPLPVEPAVTPGVVTAVSDPGVAYVNDSRFGEITGGDITANLQAAINDPLVKVVRVPSGEFIVGAVNIDKLKQKVLTGAGRDVTKLTFNKAATNHMVLATSGAKLSNGTIRDLTIDMGWETGDTVRNAFQLSNAMNMTFKGLRVVNVGGNAILVQSLGTKSDAVATGADFDDIILDQIGLANGTTGFGIQLKGNAGDANLRNLRISNVKGGMGIGGVDDDKLGKGPCKVIIKSSFITMIEGTTAFEPIGFTKMCHDITVEGNHLVSFDNGTSLSGSRCKFSNNTVYLAWNFGVALGSDDADFEATVGATVTGNTFGDVGLQNETRDAAKPVEYAVVRLAKPRRCVVSSNTYIGRPKLPAYFVKIQGQNFGFNQIEKNSAALEDFSKMPVNNTVATDTIQEFKSASSGTPAA